MKTFKYLFLILFGSLFFVACDEIEKIEFLNLKRDNPLDGYFNSPDGSGNIAAGLVAYYTFDDEKVTDVTGNGYDGTLVNSPDFIDDTPDESGKAVFLKKANGQKIILPNPVKTTATYNVYFSISLWLKDVGNGNIVTGEGGTSAKAQPSLQISNGNFMINSRDYGTANLLQNGQWHHLVITFAIDSGMGRSVSLYVDGNLYGSNSSIGISAETSVINIGGALTFSGFTEANTLKADNIRFYSRALNAAEVKQIYAIKQ